jgi:hypothetical protein
MAREMDVHWQRTFFKGGLAYFRACFKMPQVLSTTRVLALIRNFPRQWSAVPALHEKAQDFLAQLAEIMAVHPKVIPVGIATSINDMFKELLDEAGTHWWKVDLLGTFRWIMLDSSEGHMHAIPWITNACYTAKKDAKVIKGRYWVSIAVF